jgi:hypothetical protein
MLEVLGHIHQDAFAAEPIAGIQLQSGNPLGSFP